MQATGCHHEGWQCPLEDSTGTAATQLRNILPRAPSRTNGSRITEIGGGGWIKKGLLRVVGRALEKSAEGLVLQLVLGYTE